jgi:hypothetical protein
MEHRSTLQSGENFLKLLRQLHEEGKNASMILDSNGLIRAEGIIAEVVSNAKRPYLTLTNGTKIDISSIAAVNGIFLPEYSEC